MENLSDIILSVLFVAGESVNKADIISKLNVQEDEFNTALDELKTRFKDNSGIVILDFNNKVQLASNSMFSEQVSAVLNPIRERNLSKATLETIAIIAYKQPITRLEIEEIRGVSCDYAISILLEHNLIEVVGRKDAVGRPVLFGTTDEFLKRFNLTSINQLPDYNTLLEQIEVLKTKPNESLYNEFSVPTEKITPDSAIIIDANNNGEVLNNGNSLDESETVSLDNKTKFEFLDIIRTNENPNFDEFV